MPCHPEPATSRLLAAASAILALALLAGGCAVRGNASSNPDPGGAASAPLRPVDHVSRLVVQRLAAADQAFAGELYAALRVRGATEGAAGNVVISPASIATALQMAYTGARGETALQMRRVLRVNGLSVADVAAAAGALAAQATSGRGSRLELASTVWVQKGLAVRAAYLAALRDGFAAALQRADFVRDPEGARLAIDALIAAQTAGHIRDLLPPGSLSPLTRLVLANAVYLKAAWATPFPAGATTTGPFHAGRSGATVTARMMHLTTALGYERGDGYQAVAIPYAGGRLAMTIVLPDGPLAPLEQRLAGTGLASLSAHLHKTEVALALPAFRFATTEVLNPILSALGMPVAFSAAADFSGITPAEQLQVALVIHKAFIAVNEHGTEAAAATAVSVQASAAIVSPPAAVTVDVDRPFIFAITDSATGLPLFLGRVADPSAP